MATEEGGDLSGAFAILLVNYMIGPWKAATQICKSLCLLKKPLHLVGIQYFDFEKLISSDDLCRIYCSCLSSYIIWSLGSIGTVNHFFLLETLPFVSMTVWSADCLPNSPRFSIYFVVSF